MLTEVQKATCVLALGHMIRILEQMGSAPSVQDRQRLHAIITKVDEKPELQLEKHDEIRETALGAMEALVADIH